MKNKTPKKAWLTSRVQLSPELEKRVEAKRKKLSPIPKLKPFLEILIEQGLQNTQPQG